MGDYIDGVVQQKRNGEWRTVIDFSDYDVDEKYESFPLGWQSYAAFAVLAGVRNYAEIEPIAPHRGTPPGWDWAEGRNRFGSTWYDLDELLQFDWTKPLEDRRGDGVETLPAGQGKLTNYGDYFGQDRLAQLRQIRTEYTGEVRLIVGFY